MAISLLRSEEAFTWLLGELSRSTGPHRDVPLQVNHLGLIAFMLLMGLPSGAKASHRR